MTNTNVLLRLHQIPGIERLHVYRQNGGYEALFKAATWDPKKIIEMVEESGLRGRGGSGFPTGTKWRAVAYQENVPHYFVCNIAEGEPGCFKDRALLKNPHQVLESTAIAAYAIGAQKAFIYLRGSFRREEKILTYAHTQALEEKLLGLHGLLPVEVIVHRGEDSYIAGEETALLESLEGKAAIPRTKPPRPHEAGLWDAPTVVNNVETICNIIPIVLFDVAGFRKFGTAQSPGTKLFCLSGQIRRPGLYELPLGIRLSVLLNESGEGPLPDRRFVAVFPGGPSTAILPVEKDPALDFESLREAGTSLGTGGMIVLDNSSDMLKVALEVSDFFARESCGTCPPCKIGTSEIHRLFVEISKEVPEKERLLLKIKEFCEMMKFRGNCAHDRAAAFTILSLLERYRGVFLSAKSTGTDASKAESVSTQ
jgi:NADH-quinone oxidoreductase subunit F